MEEWAYRRAVPLACIRPGQPVENAFIESCTGRLLDACLNRHPFASRAEAQAILEAWRTEDTHHRPHSSLGPLTPDEFLAQRQALSTVEEVLCSG